MSARALSGGRRDPARSRGQARPQTLCPASHRRDGRGRRRLKPQASAESPARAPWRRRATSP